MLGHPEAGGAEQEPGQAASAPVTGHDQGGTGAGVDERLGRTGRDELGIDGEEQ